MIYTNKWSTESLLSSLKDKIDRSSASFKSKFYIICVLVFGSYFGCHIGLAIYRYHEAHKVDYSDVVYNDPFKSYHLKPAQREILNYAVARRYLIQEINKHPYWSDSETQSAVYQIEQLFHVEHLTTNMLSTKQTKQLIDVCKIIAGV